MPRTEAPGSAEIVAMPNEKCAQPAEDASLAEADAKAS